MFAAFVPPAGEAIRAHATKSQEFAQQTQDKQPRSFEEMVPEQYRDFAPVFTKESFDELPPRRPWDHAIELKPDADLVGAALSRDGPASEEVVSLAGAKSGLRISFATNRAYPLFVRAHSHRRHAN